MFKTVFAATAALSMSASAALAGPYVNVEANASYPDGDYSSAVTDLHVGLEGGSGRLDTMSKVVLLASTVRFLMTLRPNSQEKLVCPMLPQKILESMVNWLA